MKRGPSKGYIKELADRLNTLEGAIQHGELPVSNQLMSHSNDGFRRPSDEFSPPPNAETGQQKRTFSNISGEFGTAYQPQRPANWANSQATQSQSQQLQQTSPYATPQSAQGQPNNFREPDYSPSCPAPTPHWRNPPDTARQDSSSESVLPVEPIQPEQHFELSDAVIEGYYNTIHPTYPILPHSNARLKTTLSNCRSSLRQAICEVLPPLVRSLAPSQENAAPQNLSRAAQLVTAFQVEHIPAHSFSENLVLLQTMLLLAIAAETHTSKTHFKLSRAAWLGSAAGIAYSLKLHLHRTSEDSIESDPDSDESMSRRIWWSLVIMDRWHASSTSSPTLVPDGSVVIYPEDQALLGESSYQLARLSVILGHLAEAALVPSDLSYVTTPPFKIICTLLRGELERWRESLPQNFFLLGSAQLVHICYSHLRILIELQLPEAEPLELLSTAAHIVADLTSNAALISPLPYQCAALAALTLIDLMDIESTKQEAEKSLQALLQIRIVPSSWDEAIRDFITKRLAPSSEALTASQGLQHLAELATAETEEGRAEKDEGQVSRPPPQNHPQLRSAVRSGYLSYILGNGD